MRVISYATMLLVVTAVVVFVREYQTHLLNLLEPEHLKNLMRSFGWGAPLVFLVVSILLMLMSVSHGILAIAAGLLFGPVGGCVIALIATCIAGQLAFCLTRRFYVNQLESVKSWRRVGKVLCVVEEKCKTNGFKNLFILRCLLLPYILLSYAGGMIKTLSGRDFFLATLLAHLAITPALVLLGSTLLEGPRALILPVTMVVLVLIVPKVYKAVVVRGDL